MSLHSRRQADWWGAGLLESRPAGAPWAIARSTVTYGQLRAQVSSLCHTLRSYGIGAGHTVALQGARSFTQMWALFALWSCGAQVMLMGPGLRGRELGTLLDRCRPQYHLSFDAPGWAAGTFHDECEVLVRRLKGGRPAETPHCLVQFTSGSTGVAKAIGRTPESVTTELGRFRAIGGMPRPGEKALLLAPPEHSFGLIGGLLHAMNTGAVPVFARDTGPRAVLDACRVHDVEAVLGAPGHFAGLASWPADSPDSPDSPDAPASLDAPASSAGPARGGVPSLPRLRMAISAGDVLVRQVSTRFAERFGVRIGQAYGTTETGIIAVDAAGVYGPGTVGVPAPGVRVRLVSGELQVRLPGSPYLAPEEPPARFLADGGRDPGGWLCTRDLVEVDRSGALRLLGRLDPPADRQVLTAGATQRQVSDRTVVRRLDRDGSFAH